MSEMPMSDGSAMSMMWMRMPGQTWPDAAASFLGMWIVMMVAMQQPALARAVPIAVGVVVLIAGALQFTAWKAHHLACCRVSPRRGRTLPANAGTAWRYGLRLGLHCSYCCAGLIAIPLVIGVMDLRALPVPPGPSPSG